MKAWFILVLLTLGVFATKEISRVVNELKEKVGNDAYGNQITDLVELHLLQGSQVQQIIKLVGDIITQLESDQNVDDISHSSRMAEFESTVNQLEQNLETLNGENQSNNRALGDLSTAVAQLAGTISSLSNQLTTNNKNEQNARNSRNDEAYRYQTGLTLNRANLQNTVDAKNILVKKQGTIKSNQDKAYYQTLIDPFTQLESTYKQSIQINEKSEKLSQDIFQALVNEITSLRNNLSLDYQTAINTKKTKTNDLAITQRKRDEYALDLITTQNLAVQTRGNRDTFDSDFHSRSQNRKSELDTIQAAYTLIHDNAEQLEKQN